jgi:hypothetical protein
MNCWNQPYDPAATAAFAAQAATDLRPVFPSGCRGSGCPERIWNALLDAQHLSDVPGIRRGYACGMVAQPEFRDESNEASVRLVTLTVGDCARTLEGQPALECQIGAVARMTVVFPDGLWDQAEGKDPWLWRRGSEPSDFLLTAVFSLHPLQAIAATILVISPLILFALVRWLLWVRGGW